MEKVVETTAINETVSGSGSHVICPDDFVDTPEGCLFLVDQSDEISWKNAEAYCQGYGNNVHLIDVASQKVCKYHAFTAIVCKL